MIHFSNQETGKIRLIDCVGYLVPEAVGAIEEEKERMVKTPGAFLSGRKKSTYHAPCRLGSSLFYL